jgi:hypothetical protein
VTHSQLEDTLRATIVIPSPRVLGAGGEGPAKTKCHRILKSVFHSPPATYPLSIVSECTVGSTGSN